MTQGTVSMIKERLLIAQADTAYDASCTIALAEANRLMSIECLPYVTDVSTITGSTILFDIAEDIAAGIVKRRHFPNMMDESGWLKLGLDKLHIFINNTYVYQGTFNWSTNSPEDIMGVLDKGVINLGEARTLLEACTLDTTSENILYVEAQIDLIDAQINKLNAETSFIGAQSTKLSTVDTANVTADTALKNAQVTKIGKDGLLVDATELLTDAQKLKTDAETDVLEADLTRMSADLTKITAENAVLAQQVLNLQADVTHLTALNGNLTAINSKLGVETTKIAGADTDLEEAQSALLGSQKSMVDSQILTTSTIISSTLIWNPKDFEEARDIITASISKLTQAQVLEILRAVPRQKGFSYLIQLPS